MLLLKLEKNIFLGGGGKVDSLVVISQFNTTWDGNFGFEDICGLLVWF